MKADCARMAVKRPAVVPKLRHRMTVEMPMMIPGVSNGETMRV